MFLTIVDNYTRTTWLYLIKYKSQCVRFLTHFVSFVHNQFNSTVKAIRTNNVKELCEGDILNIYQEKGILHQKSCSYTPQQNRVVERKHQYLLETARALKFQSNLPNKFWREFAFSTAYLINRMPLVPSRNKTPY